MKYLIVFFICCFFVLTALGDKEAGFVNPFIGTAGHGHTFPGATTPFGMVQLSPDTDNQGWDWCSGYHYSDSSLLGFSHTHLSGTGGADYGDVLIAPMDRFVSWEGGSKDNPDEGYRSRFSHDEENAEAGYYSVFLKDYHVLAELTATPRTGFHQYVFSKKSEKCILMDLVHGIQDSPLEAHIEAVSPTRVVGYRQSKGWAADHTIYFVMDFSQPVKEKKFRVDGEEKRVETVKGKKVKAFFRFGNEGDERLLVKTGISHVSIEGACKNLETELPHWDFEKIREKASELWEKELEKVEITASEDKKTVFYTALYHSFIAPNISTDVDGNYVSMDGKIKNSSFPVYTVFSLWDTFRATHPLFLILQPQRARDMVGSIILKYEEKGLPPVWELASNETNCMIGYHSIPVVADALIKGMEGVDREKAFEAMKAAAFSDVEGLDHYRENGYIPAEEETESVSKTLEYAYDDWCIAEVASLLGKNDDYIEFSKRACFYRNVFDRETYFARSRKNGQWSVPFDPYSVSGDYTEANAWQYSNFTPHAIPDMIYLFGGKENLELRLDSLFAANPEFTGRSQSDISGLIGQYAHGNEPSHHVAYLYNFTRSPWKTAEKVRRIMDELYGTGPAGLCGNEDCGQMSSWLNFSAMGFYPVTPGRTEYLIGTPWLDEVKIHIGEAEFTIKAQGLNSRSIYIEKMELNGEPFDKGYLKHEDIMSGGELVFFMSEEPNKEAAWETPVFKEPVRRLTANPLILCEKHTFKDSIPITLKNPLEEADIYYTLDGTPPTENSKKYSGAFYVRESGVIQAFAVKDGYYKSFVTKAELIKIPYDRNIELKTAYSPIYSAGGDDALIDYRRGEANFHSGTWQGYEQVGIEAIVDLKELREINSVKAGFMHCPGFWIFYPLKVEFFVSEDGINFRKAALCQGPEEEAREGKEIKDFEADFGKIKARFIKMKAENRGLTPSWHQAPGGKAWLFCDEIVIN